MSRLTAGLEKIPQCKMWFLQAGDIVRLEIEKIGILENRVVEGKTVS